MDPLRRGLFAMLQARRMATSGDPTAELLGRAFLGLHVPLGTITEEGARELGEVLEEIDEENRSAVGRREGRP